MYNLNECMDVQSKHRTILSNPMCDYKTHYPSCLHQLPHKCTGDTQYTVKYKPCSSENRQATGAQDRPEQLAPPVVEPTGSCQNTESATTPAVKLSVVNPSSATGKRMLTLGSRRPPINEDASINQQLIAALNSFHIDCVVNTGHEHTHLAQMIFVSKAAMGHSIHSFF